MADAIIHSSVDTSHEMVNINLHKQLVDIVLDNEDLAMDEKLKAYSTKSKVKVDFTDLTKEHIKEEDKGIAVKPLVIDDDVVAVCKDMNSLDLNAVEYNIWNM